MGIFKLFIFTVLTVAAFVVAVRGVRRLGYKRASAGAIMAWSAAWSAAIAMCALLAFEGVVYRYFYARPERYETPESAGAMAVYMLVIFIAVVATALFFSLKKDGLACRSVAIWRAAARARREMEWRI